MNFEVYAFGHSPLRLRIDLARTPPHTYRDGLLVGGERYTKHYIAVKGMFHEQIGGCDNAFGGAVISAAAR
jgi:hypothetical protein